LRSHNNITIIHHSKKLLYAYQDFPSVPDEPLFHLLIELNKYGLPIVFTIGVFLNILTGHSTIKAHLVRNGLQYFREFVALKRT
jgi:hypothetical protein